jgi:protein-disulfide isomerase
MKAMRGYGPQNNMNIKAIAIFLTVTLGMLLGVGGLLWQFGKSAEAPITDIAGERRHAMGTGEVTVVEFSDFQCPACQSVEAPLKQILAKYPDKVVLVYRHFPLTSIHPNAQIAAQAAEAADNQGKFWEMHDLLFAKQAEWSGQENPREALAAYATLLGMDTAKFIAELESQAGKDVIAADVVAATKYRISGTPTFYVNGIKTEFGQLDARLAELTK